MITVVITEKGGAQRRLEFDKSEITIGRTKGNDIILPKGNVSKRHSRVVLKDSRFIVVDLKSTNGTYVNGRKITSPVVVHAEDKVYIGDFVLALESAAAMPVARALPTAPSEAPVASVQSSAVAQRSSPPLLPEVGDGAAAASRASMRPPNISQPLAGEPMGSIRPPSTAPRSLAAREKKSRLSRLPWTRLAVENSSSKATDLNSALRLMMLQIGNALGSEDLQGMSFGNTPALLAEEQVDAALRTLETQGLLDERLDREALAEASFHEAVGLGALERLLIDRQVQELLIQGPQHIFADYGQGLKPLECIAFSSQRALEKVATRLFALSDITIDTHQPIQQCRLADGSHVTLWQRPLAPEGPILRIRRRAGIQVSPESLLEEGVLSEGMLLLLKEALRQRTKILVSGPPRSGVSKLLSGLAAMLPRSEWIISMSSDVSLDIQHEQRIALSREEAFVQGDGAAVLAQARQLHYTWLVIDDISGAEAFDVLQASASSTVGALIGLHTSGLEDPMHVYATLMRFHQLAPVLVAPLIAEIMELVVELEVDKDGKSFVKSIRELVGSRGDTIKTQDLFVFQDGEFVASGKSPKFLEA
ncbi:MAG: Flp pilus assembly complex ATPase component TadA [Myxococcales bacterium]|nr:Flp pilus assembly complex ATPase component TadA [Myxococcales bacterium]